MVCVYPFGVLVSLMWALPYLDCVILFKGRRGRANLSAATPPPVNDTVSSRISRHSNGFNLRFRLLRYRPEGEASRSPQEKYIVLIGG